jgi:hypothetical protein
MIEPKIAYTYINAEGNRLQRTFSLSEIKAGEDDAHLAIIPGYELERIECPLCSDFAIGAAALRGGLNLRGEPFADALATKQIQCGVDKLQTTLDKWKEEHPI